MSNFIALWLPVLLSAVAVFIASSVLHMVVMSWHKDDCLALPNESKLLDALRPLAISPGDYAAPMPASMADMKTPEFAAKMKAGPVVLLTVRPNCEMNMGRALLLWFVYCVVVSALAAYVASVSLAPGASFGRVNQVVGATALAGYSLALWQAVIWYGRSFGAALRTSLDGLLYAVLTGLVFGWMWPAA
jgi:hypothetical protein